jgi:hypothetical protein
MVGAVFATATAAVVFGAGSVLRGSSPDTGTALPDPSSSTVLPSTTSVETSSTTEPVPTTTEPVLTTEPVTPSSSVPATTVQRPGPTPGTTPPDTAAPNPTAPPSSTTPSTGLPTSPPFSIAGATYYDSSRGGDFVRFDFFYTTMPGDLCGSIQTGMRGSGWTVLSANCGQPSVDGIKGDLNMWVSHDPDTMTVTIQVTR